MGKNVGINISKNLSGKYSHKRLDHAKESATDVFKTSSKTKFEITDTKRYVPIITLSTQENEKMLEQLKSGFKRTINWNKYQSKMPIERPNECLDYSIDPSF